MNSFERVMNRLVGKPVDYLPNMSITMLFAAKEIGVPFGEYCSDYRKMADGVLRCHERYGIDMVCPISDSMREPEGFGTEIIIPKDGMPYPKSRRILTLADIDTLKVIDPASGRRMNEQLEAICYLKERVGKDVPVIGWVEGAIAESCDLMDMQEFFMTLLDEPEAARHLMDICMEQELRFADAQVKAGADMIGLGDAASSLIGPALYEEFALPYQERMIEEIHRMGVKVKLHICGDLNPVLPLVARTGADIVDLDYMVDLEAAVKVFPESVSICGNFNPVDVLLLGKPALVREEVRRCLKIAEQNRSIISPGCEVPRDTPPENLLTVHETIKEFGYSR